MIQTMKFCLAKLIRIPFKLPIPFNIKINLGMEKIHFHQCALICPKVLNSNAGAGILTT